MTNVNKGPHGNEATARDSNGDPAAIKTTWGFGLWDATLSTYKVFIRLDPRVNPLRSSRMHLGKHEQTQKKKPV